MSKCTISLLSVSSGDDDDVDAAAADTDACVGAGVLVSVKQEHPCKTGTESALHVSC